MKDKNNNDNKNNKKFKDKNKESIKLRDIEQELKECQEKRDEYLAGWQRVQADFSNYKKEETKRLKSLSEYVNLNAVSKVLPILDNFDLIEKNLSEEVKNDKNIRGVLQIKTQILDFLKNQKIEEIKAIGENFNPNFHEAIEQVEIEGEKSDIIIEEIQKGYKFQDKVIRPTKVKVTK